MNEQDLMIFNLKKEILLYQSENGLLREQLAQ